MRGYWLLVKMPELILVDIQSVVFLGYIGFFVPGLGIYFLDALGIFSC